MDSNEPPKRKAGRPLGSKNKAALDRGNADRADYDYPDPDTLVARQLSMVNWAQVVVRNEFRRAMENRGSTIVLAPKDIERLEKLSNTLVRTIDALKKSSDLTEELSKRMSPEQLLDAAIRKIEAQDLKVLNYAIKRLRAHRERIAPTGGQGPVVDTATASDAVASLESE
jgi:hypothetical protein